MCAITYFENSSVESNQSCTLLSCFVVKHGECCQGFPGCTLQAVLLWLNRPKGSAGLAAHAAAVDGPFHVRTAAVDSPFHVRTAAVDGPFHVRTAAVDGPFHIHTAAVDGPFHVCTAAVDGPFHVRTAAVDGPFHVCTAAVDGPFHVCAAAVDGAFTCMLQHCFLQSGFSSASCPIFLPGLETCL